MKRSPAIVTLILLMATACTQASDIIISAWASDGYMRPTATESCSFLKGQYFGPAFEEDEAPQISFEEVATILSTHLSEQGYVMAPKPLEANLLLVVHWGETGDQDDEPDVSMMSFSGPGDSFGEIDDISDSRSRLNARLLGIGETKKGIFRTLRDDKLEEAIRQERYFINVVAYSMQEVLTKKAEEPQLKPRWATRFSIPRQGNEDIDEAMQTISATASNYFGRNLSDVEMLRKDEKQAIVEIGELEFIGTIDDDAESTSDVPTFSPQANE